MRERAGALAALMVTLLAGCFHPDTEDVVPPDLDALAPPVDLFQRDAGLADAETDAVLAPCGPTSGLHGLHFSASTSPAGGRFRPKNVGAIWIADASGGFVRTLKVWGTVRTKWLSAWLAASGGDTVDAVTGATLIEHQTHAVTWDLMDRHGCEVAAGQYSVWIELTDRSGTGTSLNISFTKGTEALVVSPPDTEVFQGMRLTLE